MRESGAQEEPWQEVRLKTLLSNLPPKTALRDHSGCASSTPPNHPVDRPTPVIADIGRPVCSNHQPHRSSHPLAAASLAGRKPTRDEILHRPRFSAIIHLYTDYFVPGPHAAVPGSVEGHKQVTLIFGGKHSPFVKH